MKVKQALYKPLDMAKSTLAYRAVAFGYANARIKSMRQGLLTKRDMSSMIEAKSVQELVGVLEKTPYREEFVEEILGRGQEDMIEFALARRLEKVVAKIRRIAPENMQKELESVLARFDVHNIETLLVAKHLKKPKEEILPFIAHAGTIEEKELNRIVELGSVKQVVLFLEKTRYGEVLERELEQYEKDNDIQPMLSALDQYYLGSLAREFSAAHADDKIILGIFRAEIDRKNVSSILRGKKNGLKEKEIRKFLVLNGGIDSAVLDKMIRAENVEKAVSILAESVNLKNSLQKFRQDGKLSHFEIELETRVMEKSLSALRRSVLSLGAIIGFIMMVEEETKNIRKIVRSKQFDLEKKEVLEMIVGLEGLN